jgi:hypothetical protein
MARRRAVINGLLAAACSVAVSASANVPKGSLGRLLTPVDVVPRASTALLRVEDVLLEAPLKPQAWPSAVLKFKVLNDGPTPLTDLVLEISVTELRERDRLPGRALVRPFTVRGHIVLLAGYSMQYEMLLRNLSPSCDCVASVDVVSVRWLADNDF